MSIAGYNSTFTTINIPDPAGDATLLALKAPSVGATILNAWVSLSTAVDADGSNHILCSLLDGGAAGAGTTSMGSFGGASVDYAAHQANAMTLTQDSVDGGDHILFRYDETGTVAPGYVTLVLEWSHGGD
jgi:hypothetical protein